MPFIQVTMREGRSPEAIRSMVSALTAAVVDTGIAPKNGVRVFVNELPATHIAAGDVTLAERTEQDQNTRRDA